MKKFLATVIALSAITAAFTGCTGNNNSTSDNGSSASGSGVTSDAGASGAVGTSEPSMPEVRTAADLGMAASTCIDWYDLEPVDDAEIIKSMMNIDTSLCDEYYVAVSMMSVHLNEVVIVKPSEGNEETIKTQLDEHFAYIKDGAAFYPEQEIQAAGAVQGKTDDGFYYIIVHQIGSEIADIMNAYKPGEEVPHLDVPEDENGDNGVVVVPTDEIGEPFYGSDVAGQSTAE